MESTTASDCDMCAICKGALIEKRLKKFCTRCGQLCETCCDTGKPADEHAEL